MKYNPWWMPTLSIWGNLKRDIYHYSEVINFYRKLKKIARRLRDGSHKFRTQNT